MAKTVQQIKADKSEVEGKMRINYVEVKTDSHSYEEKEKVREGKGRGSLRKLKGVLDVMIQMDLGDDPDSLESAVAGG